LRRAPASAKSQKECDWLLIKPKTSGGMAAAALGYYYRKGSMELTVTINGDDEFSSVVDSSTSCEKAHWHKPD
jgi:hypothetical protein